jgi:hypothetical protein
MPLTEETKELLRNSILMQLNSARPVGLRIDPIHVGVKLAGFQTLPKEELAKQLRYLEAHQMIERAEKEISKSVEVFMITETGVAHLDESGLI